MTSLSRFQLDLTPADAESIERWSAFAGFRTKREFLLNAFTLFQWAAKQVMLGRTICAMNEATGEVRQLEMPALATIAEQAKPSFLNPEEVRRATAQSGSPFAEFVATLKESAGGEEIHGDIERRDKQPAR
jgi:hypothetical protein